MADGDTAGVRNVAQGHEPATRLRSILGFFENSTFRSRKWGIM